MANLNLISMNVRGLNMPAKCSKALAEFQRLKGDVIFVQETHFREGSAPGFRNARYPTGYFSNFGETKSRGVAILFARHVPFTLQDVVTDPQGRFLMVKGMLGNTKLTFVNVYLPNRLQTKCLRKVLRRLSEFQEGFVVLGGDCNVSLDMPADCVQGGGSSVPSLRVQFHKLLSADRLIDCWRLSNPAVKDYTFYSHAFKKYSRIDYFFVEHRALEMVRSCKIGPITWSDHAPLLLSLALPNLVRTENAWRLNESLLSDPMTRAEVTASLENYFLENDTDDVTPATVWEAHKCVLRGAFIQLGSRRKKERTARMEELLRETTALELTHKSDLDPESFRRLVLLRADLAKLTNA
uniref:exodeoxyribonuclease III n=1 Tax=Leptobrachium leishanense TaxID=445787 RepID=A0A8C5PL06_9ANUR